LSSLTVRYTQIERTMQWCGCLLVCLVLVLSEMYGSASEVKDEGSKLDLTVRRKRQLDTLGGDHVLFAKRNFDSLGGAEIPLYKRRYQWPGDAMSGRMRSLALRNHHPNPEELFLASRYLDSLEDEEAASEFERTRNADTEKRSFDSLGGGEVPLF